MTRHSKRRRAADSVSAIRYVSPCFAFVRDHTRGAPLALVIVMLVIFALDVPVVIAFTVARYSSPPYASSCGGGQVSRG